MFTGLVETIGTVSRIASAGGVTRIEIESDLPVDEMRDGESVSVDGACLTVTARSGNRFSADAVAETLARTTLGRLRAGSRVHLERALRVGDRLGGHFVQGHVDAACRVVRVSRRAGDWRLVVALPPGIRRYVALKGSIAVQGVSLTVAGVDGGSFEVALVPETLRRTLLESLRPGNEVNVEVDLVSRYLERLGERRD